MIRAAAVLAGCVVIGAVGASAWSGGHSLVGQPRIIDGDTIAFGRERVRLAGIDAPEMGQRCMMPEGSTACGIDARTALIALIAGREVRCESSDRDRYGRAVATCWAGELDLNRAMVSAGWAVAYWTPIYNEYEASAHAARRGIWAGRFERPADWRREHRSR